MLVAIKFVRQWRGSDRIVWIDISKLNKSWRRERSYYLPRGTPNRTADWISRLSFRRVPMPHVALDERDDVSFTDGRHRFAWFRDHGVKAMPVTIATKTEAEKLRKLYGSRRRSVRLSLSLFPHHPQGPHVGAVHEGRLNW